MRYTIRRIDGRWTLFNGTGPIAWAKTIKELLAPLKNNPVAEVIGDRVGQTRGLIRISGNYYRMAA